MSADKGSCITSILNTCIHMIEPSVSIYIKFHLLGRRFGTVLEIHRNENDIKQIICRCFEFVQQVALSIRMDFKNLRYPKGSKCMNLHLMIGI